MLDIEITPQDAKALIDAGNAQLIDVREDYEWEAGRIPGARHIELSVLAGQAATIDKELPVIFQCRVGNRSQMPTHAFRGAGYEAYSMAGGLQRWHDEGLPVEPEDGIVAPH